VVLVGVAVEDDGVRPVGLQLVDVDGAALRAEVELGLDEHVRAVHGGQPRRLDDHRADMPLAMCADIGMDETRPASARTPPISSSPLPAVAC
jgi:hypothetical protein